MKLFGLKKERIRKIESNGVNHLHKYFSKEFYFYTEEVSIISKAIFKYFRENYDLIFHCVLKEEKFMICLQNGWLSKNLLIEYRNDISKFILYKKTIEERVWNENFR